MFVPEALLKSDLRALVEKAINKWSETQPLGFTRPLVEECGDFIASEMDARGLRCLKDGVPWFNPDATAEEFRECVFAALEHWLVGAEISREPLPIEDSHQSEQPAENSGSAVPFSTAEHGHIPQVDPYTAFDESWGLACPYSREDHEEKIVLPPGWRMPKEKRLWGYREWILAAIILGAFVVLASLLSR